MTIKQILQAVKPHKPMTRVTLYTWLRKLKIKPLGERQSPQNYPDDTPDRILTKLGFNSKKRRAA